MVDTEKAVNTVRALTVEVGVAFDVHRVEVPASIDVDYTDGEGETPSDYPSLQHKIEKAVEVTRRGLEQYDNPAVMWTGGKDSTLMLYFINQVAEEDGYEKPTAVFIDHYQHFDDITDFVDRWADEWEIELVYARNEDVGAYVDEHGPEPGDDIPVDELNEQNQHHIRDILEYEEDTFPFLLDTYVGNHLLKTVALNNALEAHDIDGVISGVRWDEQEARADETFWRYVVPDTVEAFPDEGPEQGGPDGAAARHRLHVTPTRAAYASPRPKMACLSGCYTTSGYFLASVRSTIIR